MALMILAVAAPSAGADGSSTTVVFSTDFEGVGFFISAWEPLGWSRGDYSAGHEDDLWCRLNSTYLHDFSSLVGDDIAARSPSALYGARLGTNSGNGIANLANGYPDPGMDSWVRFAPPNADSYDGMSLTFWYWAKTQDAGYQGPLGDYLCVNINNGVTTTRAWTQPAPDSGGWQMATIDLPPGTVWMEWEFKTSETSAGYPGVLIDDITVTADGAASGYPFSTVGEMSSYYASSDIQVPVTVANTDSLVLYYRAGDGEWTKYADDAHPDGEFPAAPLVFRALADGQYELYSVAAGSGLQEDMKAGAEAAFTIDTKAPTVAVTAPVQGSVIVPGAISLEWTAGDDGSGIARTEVSVDGGSWTEVPATPYSTGPLADGERSVEVRVTDSVGWTARSSVAFVVDPSAPAMTVSPIGPGAPLGAAVVALFQEAVDQDSVAVEVGGVAGRLSWDGDKVAFAPSEPLEPERTYSVAVTGNKAGGDLFSVEWSFTTVKNSGGISGTVRASDGRAVANATVALSNGGGDHHRCRRPFRTRGHRSGRLHPDGERQRLRDHVHRCQHSSRSDRRAGGAKRQDRGG